MAFADTDGTTLIALEETTFNTVVANSVNWKTVRAKGWDVNPMIATVESEELSSNVDVLDVVTVTQAAKFSASVEYAKDAFFETMLEHVFRSAFATNVLKGGVVRKSMTFEEKATGTAAEYALVSGVRLDNFSLNGAVGKIIECQFTGSGAAPSFGATSAVGTGTLAAAGTNRALSLTDMTAFTMTGDVTSLVVLDFQLQLTNNTREQYGAGSKSLQGVGYGTRRITGNFTAYFETREQVTKLLGTSKYSLSFLLSDGTNSHTWVIPNIKFTSLDKPVSGRSSDLTQKIGFTATYNAGSSTSVQITRT